MGDGGVSFGAGVLIAFLLLSFAAGGVFYGRFWERKKTRQAAEQAEMEMSTSLQKLGESAKDLTVAKRGSGGRRSTLSMPPVDKKKPSATPPPPPAAAKPPKFRGANHYVTEV